MADATNLRQRKTEPSGVVVPNSSAKSARPKGSAWGILDTLRVLGGLVLLSTSLSFFVMGDSLTWGYDPKWAKWGSIKSLWTPPLELTLQELSIYNGTDPTLPIYLSINNTIYDVTVGRSKYGPGGGYHFFAGRDATRAYVTGCFKEDLTNDLRGLEDMFEGDVEDPVAEVWGKVNHWVKFFKNHKEYFEVGKLVGWEEEQKKTPMRELCEQAGGKVKRHLANQRRKFEKGKAKAKAKKAKQ